MNHTELAELWNSAHTAWAEDQPLPAALDRLRACYTGTSKFGVDDLAMPEPWTGDLTAKPAAVTLSMHPGSADPAFHHRNGSWANTIQDQHDGSYAGWAAKGPYFGDVWESAHGANAHAHTRLRSIIAAGEGVDLTARDEIAVSARAEWANFAMEAPSGT